MELSLVLEAFYGGRRQPHDVFLVFHHRPWFPH
jgi:hypothetical protein